MWGIRVLTTLLRELRRSKVQADGHPEFSRFTEKDAKISRLNGVVTYRYDVVVVGEVGDVQLHRELGSIFAEGHFSAIAGESIHDEHLGTVKHVAINRTAEAGTVDCR